MSRTYSELHEMVYGKDEIIVSNVGEIPVAKELYKKEKPEHYDIGIDTFERMRANATFEEYVGMCKATIDKYTWRKKGQDREDLIKIIDYANEWIWAIDNRDTFKV